MRTTAVLIHYTDDHPISTSNVLTCAVGARGGLGRFFTSMVTNFLHTVRIELSLCVMLMHSDDVNEEQHFITQLHITRFI